MKALGIRCTPTEVRLAVLDSTAALPFANAASDNRLRFPPASTTMPERLVWLYRELQRFLQQHGPFDRAAVKVNEFNARGRETQVSRDAAALVAVALLVLAQAQVPVEAVTYRALGTNRTAAMAAAQANYGTSTRNWNVAMADAVLAADFTP